MNIEILDKLGAKKSTSEERGLAQIKDKDLMIFSPGISTAGFAEIRMAKANPNRKIIATTIDKKGLDFARDIIKQVGLDGQIETREEDLRSDWNYPPDYFDFIYSRLVLHYLSAQDLDKVLAGFNKSLKPDGTIFIAVRSVKNVDSSDPNNSYDPQTRFTTIFYRRGDGTTEGSSRYFHTPITISEHLNKAGLQVREISEYQERLYTDFERQKQAPKDDHIIEVIANKSI